MPRPRRPRPNENFWVLSPFLPKPLREHFRNVYAFCRAADDIADEHPGTPDSKRDAIEHLQRWHLMLDRCASGRQEPEGHAIFDPLARTIRARGLELAPFHALLEAFEQDQQETRFETWDDLLGYCRKSADPVGRIVLALDDVEPTAEQLAMSDSICTALQIVNHVQDIRRDLLTRDRLYMPSEVTGLDAHAWRSLAEAAPSRKSAALVREGFAPILKRTRELVDHGRGLSPSLSRNLSRVVYLFHAAAEGLLTTIEQQEGDTLWTRPRISRASRVLLLARAACLRARAIPPVTIGGLTA